MSRLYVLYVRGHGARAALMASVLVLVTSSVSAQASAAPEVIDTLPLLPGARVRVTASPLGPSPVVFRFAGTRNDTLLLRPKTGNSVDTTHVALANVVRVESSRGWRQRALTSGIVGAAIGAVIGGVVGYNASESVRRPCSTCAANSRGAEAFAFGATMAGYVGAGGALFGRFVLGERWQVVAGR